MIQIRKHLSEVSEGMTFLDTAEISRAVMVLDIVKKSGGTVYIFGNGGSHATASHFANDLTKINRIPAVCLGDMSPSLLAYGNDNGWENMYADLLEGLMEKGDGAVGISCSGNSENVRRALEKAQSEGVLTIALIGNESGSAIEKLDVDAPVFTRGTLDIRVQEDLHVMISHAIVRELQAV